MSQVDESIKTCIVEEHSKTMELMYKTLTFYQITNSTLYMNLTIETL